GHEEPKGDRRHHQPPVARPTDGRRGPTTRGEGALDAAVIELRGGWEAVQGGQDPAPDRYIAHELPGPRVELCVRLLVEATAVLAGVRRQSLGRQWDGSWRRRLRRRW